MISDFILFLLGERRGLNMVVVRALRTWTTAAYTRMFMFRSHTTSQEISPFPCGLDVTILSAFQSNRRRKLMRHGRRKDFWALNNQRAKEWQLNREFKVICFV